MSVYARGDRCRIHSQPTVTAYKQEKLKNQELRIKLDALRRPQNVVAEAQKSGMVYATQYEYIGRQQKVASAGKWGGRLELRGVNAKSSGENPASKHRAFVRKRTTWLFVVYAVLFAALAVRLFYVQVMCGSYYKAKGRCGSGFARYEIPASARDNPRPQWTRAGGQYQDGLGFVDTREVKDMPATVKKLAHMLCKDPKAVEAKLAGKQGVCRLARQVDAGIGEALNRKKRELPGRWLQRSIPSATTRWASWRRR